MNEGRRNKDRLKDILKAETRCIYCESAPDTIEHMPPVTMFRDRSRPKGMEFAACLDCNGKTRAADLVAGYLSRLGRGDDPNTWMVNEAVRQNWMLERIAPGFLDELFRVGKSKHTYLRNPQGVMVPKVVLNADGKLLNKYMRVFTAKLGMALYRNHVGHPLPATGGVHVQYFLNAGLADATAKALLNGMPMGSTLRQGQWTVPEQFAYRFNCDDKSIIAALIGFHNNLHFFIIATSTPEQYKLPFNVPHSDFVRIGELVGRMPVLP